MFVYTIIFVLKYRKQICNKVYIERDTYKISLQNESCMITFLKNISTLYVYVKLRFILKTNDN